MSSTSPPSWSKQVEKEVKTTMEMGRGSRGDFISVIGFLKTKRGGGVRRSAAAMDLRAAIVEQCIRDCLCPTK